MSDFDPVEIFIDLKQNVDTEGDKATKGIDEIAAASNRMREQFEKDIAAQKALTTQLINELKALKETMGKKVDTGDEKQITDKQKLVEQIDALNKKLIEQEKILEQISKKQTTPSNLPKMSNDVDAYARQVRTLNMSMTQISRELPNFAISPMIGIMSLSNNLPMLQSDIARMIQLNKELKESGQATIPVWKQVGSSLFSWQTALIAGISALMLWGPQIGSFISALFKAKGAIGLTKDELKGLNETFAKTAGADLGKLKTLFDALANAKKGTAEYYDTKKQIIDQFGGYLKGMDSEIVSLNNVKGAYEALTKAIYDNAKAKSLEKLNSDLGATLAEETTKQRESIYKQLTDKYGKNMGQVYYKAIVDALQSGKEMSYDIQRVIASFEKEVYTQQGTSTSGAVMGAGFSKINKLKDDVTAFAKAQNEFNTKTKEGKQYFDILYGSNNTSKNTVPIEQQIKNTTKSLSDAEAQLKKMRASDSTYTPDQIKLQESEIKKYKDQLESLTGINKNEIKKQLKTEEEKRDASRDLAQQELEIAQNLEESKTAAIQDGAKKQYKAIEDSYQNQLVAIEKQKKDYLEKLNKSKGFVSTDKGYITQLPSDIQTEFDQMAVNARQQRDNDIFKLDDDLVKKQISLWNQATEAFISNQDKEKRAINQKYDGLIEEARKAGSSQADIDEINAARKKAIAQVEQDTALKLSPLYQKVFGDIERYGTSTLNALRKQTDDLINSAKPINVDGKTMIQVSMPSGEFDKQGQEVRKTITMTIEEFNQWKNKLNDITQKTEKSNPFSALAKSGKAILSALKSGDKEALSDAVKTFSSNAQDAAATTKQWGDSISSIFGEDSDISKTAKKVTEIAEGTINIGTGVAKFASGDVIGGITDSLKGISQLVNAFTGSNEISQKTIDQYNNLIETINQVIDKQKELLGTLAGIAAVDQYNKSIALVEKQIEATKNLGTAYLNSGANWRKHSYGYDLHEELSQYSADFAAIGINFDSLGGRMDGLFNLTAQQLITIKEQIPEAWAALDDKTREYLQTLIDSGSALDDLKASLQEAVTGISFDTVKNGLDDLIKNVDSTWSDVADSFEEYMQDAVLNFVKSSYLTDALKEWYNQFATFYSDNTLTSEERQALETLYKTIYDNAQNLYEGAANTAGIDTSTGNTRTGSTKGIAQASQDSVDELNGRMTAIQQYIYDIRNYDAQSIDFEKEAKLYQSAVLSFLDTIATNSDYLKHLVDIKQSLGNMDLKGVKIKN